MKNEQPRRPELPRPSPLLVAAVVLGIAGGGVLFASLHGRCLYGVWTGQALLYLAIVAAFAWVIRLFVQRSGYGER